MTARTSTTAPTTGAVGAQVGGGLTASGGRHPADQPLNGTGTGTGAGGRVPGRVWRRRVAGWRLPPNAVTVERTSRWGNPFRVAEHGRAQAIERYREWILTRPEVLARLPELAGRDLACTCPLDLPCHADVLLHLANPQQQPPQQRQAHPPTGDPAGLDGPAARPHGADPTTRNPGDGGSGDGGREDGPHRPVSTPDDDHATHSGGPGATGGHPTPNPEGRDSW